ncbi:hypothetical protein ACFQ0G_53685 [Streptomyces chiangmaiensis]
MAQAVEAPAGTAAEGQTSHTLFQAARPSNTFGQLKATERSAA